MPKMVYLKANDALFVNYPYALYATDVKFQPTHRPEGKFTEQKHYYSGKHHLYGQKIEVSVSPEGLCVDMSDSFPGSVHDLTIFTKQLTKHLDFLKSRPKNGGLQTMVNCQLSFPTHGLALLIWAILAYLTKPVVFTPNENQSMGPSNMKISNVTNVCRRIALLWKTFLVVFARYGKFPMRPTAGPRRTTLVFNGPRSL